MRDMKKNTHGYTIEDTLFVCGWILGGLVCLTGLLLYFFPVLKTRLDKPCMFLTLTGFYCPGCGGTRAVLCILKGKLLESFFYSPAVLYGTIWIFVFMLTQSIERTARALGKKIKIGLKYRDLYLIIFMILFLGNWIAKNLFLIIEKVYII